MAGVVCHDTRACGLNRTVYLGTQCRETQFVPLVPLACVHVVVERPACASPRCLAIKLSTGVTSHRRATEGNCARNCDVGSD